MPVFRYTWLYCFCRLSEPPYNTHTTHSSCICSDKGLTLEMSAWNSLRWPIYVINSVDGILLPCYTLPPTQHHSFFRNLSPFFISQKYTCCCTPESHKHSRFDHKYIFHQLGTGTVPFAKPNHSKHQIHIYLQPSSSSSLSLSSLKPSSSSLRIVLHVSPLSKHPHLSVQFSPLFLLWRGLWNTTP